MRNMSFMLTERQVREGTKTVTRRLGWWFLKPGDRLMACVKCQGLGKGGKIQKIRVIEVVSVIHEQLFKIITQWGYSDVIKEGFPRETHPEMNPIAFVEMFEDHMGCEQWDVVNRIEFKYVEKP